MSRRHAFTLVEMIVTTLLTVLVMLAVFGGLTFIGSGYRRDELTMARNRIASQVFELMADDLAYAAGTADPRDLKPAGYAGTAKAFRSEAQAGEHVVHSYEKKRGALRRAYRLAYTQYLLADPAAFGIDLRKSRFRTAGPKGLNPWGITESVHVIPVPLEHPDVTFVTISKVKSGLAEGVTWSFWHKERIVRDIAGVRHYNAGTIERAGREYVRFDGRNQLGAPARLMPTVKLSNEWVHEEGADGGLFQAVELVLEIQLREPDEPLLPFASPPFIARRKFTLGL
jgi:type II secretory pathway pseudopilin PulG